MVVFFETAHPAKFRDVVEEALEQKIEIPSSLKIFLSKEKNTINTPIRFFGF
jgi:threonine synthase